MSAKTTTYRLNGHDAIRIAERDGISLRAHADPVGVEDREVSIEQAREIAREDASLIYADVVPDGWVNRDGDGYDVDDYFRGGRYLGPDEFGAEPKWRSLQTGNPNSLRVRGEGDNWWIEGTNTDNVWVDAEPGFRYSTQDEAEEAMEELTAARQEESRREFMDGFASAADIGWKDADEQWAGFSRQLSDRERAAMESGGYASGWEQGIAFRALHN